MNGGPVTDTTSGRRRPESGRAGTRAELEITKAAVVARRDALSAVRTSAAKWQAGLAALVGVVTGAVGIGVRETLRAIQPGYAIVLAVMLTVAFLLACTAVLMALRASGGMPRLVKTLNVRSDEDHVSAVAAAWSLKAAIWATGGALLALLASLWISWFAPARAELVAVVGTAAETVCGTVELADDRLVVSANDGTVRVVDLSEVTRWERADRCP